MVFKTTIHVFGFNNNTNQKEKSDDFNPTSNVLTQKDENRIPWFGCQIWGENTATIKRVYQQMCHIFWRWSGAT
ncbi:MAG: hypothetical protein WAR39_09515 [Prevotella sp.]|uniref:hypothetical protein n=1 Tax=Macellibacteroides fermentans TaxID=879969 RepID=UPI003BBF5FD9